MVRSDMLAIILLAIGGMLLIASIWLGIGGLHGIRQAIDNIRRLL